MKTTILPAVLYGTLMAEHRLRVFEDKMLRKISRPQRKKLTAD
jgi:hypothetical protein